MSGAETLTSDVDLDVAGLFSEIWRKKWLVIAITLVTGAALFVALSLSPPRYKASARVLIEKREFGRSLARTTAISTCPQASSTSRRSAARCRC